jgi:hypothetical protein
VFAIGEVAGLGGAGPGDDVEAVAVAPAAVIAGLHPGEAAILEQSSEVRARSDVPIPAESQAGAILIGEFAEYDGPIDLIDAHLAAPNGRPDGPASQGIPHVPAAAAETAPATMASAGPAPAAHRVFAVFVSKDGPSKFWDQDLSEVFFDAMSDFWTRETRGQIPEFTFDYASSGAVRSTIQCGTSFNSLVMTAAFNLGRTDRSFYNSTTDHLVILSPEEERTQPDCPALYAGMGTIGEQGLHSGGALHVIVPKDWTPGADAYVQTVAHEMGHNLSLGHASTATCPAGVVDGPFAGQGAPCTTGATIEEYSDWHNIMGWGGINTGLNGKQKEALGLIANGAGLLTALGTVHRQFVLEPTGTSDPLALQALKLLDRAGSGTKEYTVEYDQTAGGVTVRRIQSSSDPDTQTDNGAARTLILSSTGRTTPNSNKVFGAGARFVSQTGNLTIDMVRTSGPTALIDVTMGPGPTGVTLDQLAWAAPAGGATNSLTFTADASSWTAESSTPWLTVSPKSGSTGRTVAVTAAANPSFTASRTGEVTVFGAGTWATFDVTQAPRPELEVSIESWAAPYAGSSTTASVVSAAETWTANTDAAWITLSPPSGPSGTTFTLAAARNPDTDDRDAQVTVTSGTNTATIAVSQTGSPALPPSTPSPSPSSPGGTNDDDAGGPDGSGNDSPNRQAGGGRGGLQTPTPGESSTAGPGGDAGSGGDGQVIGLAPATSVRTLAASVRKIRLVQGKSVNVKVVASAVNPTDSGTAKLTWRSSRPKVAGPIRGASSGKLNAQLGRATTIKISGHALGSSTVTVTSSDGKRVAIKATVVRRAVAVKRVSIAPRSASLAIGGATRLTAKAAPAKATGAAPRWKSSRPAVAKVDATGMVTALAKGTARITATVRGKTATITVRVR